MKTFVAIMMVAVVGMGCASRRTSLIYTNAGNGPVGQVTVEMGGDGDSSKLPADQTVTSAVFCEKWGVFAERVEDCLTAYLIKAKADGLKSLADFCAANTDAAATSMCEGLTKINSAASSKSPVVHDTKADGLGCRAIAKPGDERRECW